MMKKKKKKASFPDVLISRRDDYEKLSGGDRYLQWRGRSGEAWNHAFESVFSRPAPLKGSMMNVVSILRNCLVGIVISSERAGEGGMSGQEAWNNASKKSLLPTSPPAGFGEESVCETPNLEP